MIPALKSIFRSATDPILRRDISVWISIALLAAASFEGNSETMLSPASLKTRPSYKEMMSWMIFRLADRVSKVISGLFPISLEKPTTSNAITEVSRIES